MNKWKVLIADDEYIIREGIRSSVDWEEFGMEVIGEAEDGEEAVELALKHKIDILLIDLNMPIMNGLAAMKHLRDELPHCKMVVISGYDEFHYAQEAIRLQVEDYLLKPVNPEKLKKILIELKQQLDVEVQQKSFLKQAENQIKKNHLQLKERFFQEWIAGQLTSTEIKEQLQFLEFSVEKPVQYLVIRLPDYHNNRTYLQENDRQSDLFAFESIVTKSLEKIKAAVFRDRSNLLNVCLWELVTNEQIAAVEAMIKKDLNFNIFWHLEDVNEDLSDLYQVYARCKESLDKKTRISPIVKQAQIFVQKHYQDSSLSLERVAVELHVTTVYLSRMMKQELGISYSGLLTRMRIDKAVNLLKTTDMSIREIADTVGYESQHYFSTIFKKLVGVSPKRFKQ
ncbi:response regulator [Bacillus sp. CH30_1T]|uniref:response regulator transcription factor n=1 Tax=Bacillus sp. CH30_1T TaxID=2604836 RepID=UPI0011EBD52D|nr:response regulator [Bacillus sp. CH30_1T]KAA0562270.1 response regulator [Bacillus sp. CH30_1T]